MLYIEIPQDFKSKFEVVSCFCESENEILLLKRLDSKPQGGTWGMPAGKIDKGENINEAVIREVYEESGIKLHKKDISFFKTVYVKFSDYDLIYHIFSTKLQRRPKIVIRHSEHQEYVWVSPEKAMKMKLIEDLDECIKLYFGETVGVSIAP